MDLGRRRARERRAPSRRGALRASTAREPFADGGGEASGWDRARAPLHRRLRLPAHLTTGYGGSPRQGASPNLALHPAVGRAVRGPIAR